MSSEFGLRGPKPTWACPNDRQLALRAKIQSGWSLKTNHFNTYPKPQPLTEKEQQMIVSVVKKAEEMDLTEQQRVGKLVDRLESLKKLASGNGVSECILCGDTFGLAVFGRSNYKCHDCEKAVCRKCVVELSQPKTGASSSSSSKESILRLCKLCSENRELIKKSGAWFYKGVPKYILPEKKNHYTNSYEKYAASPRYQEQKYVSRYINVSPSPAALPSSTTTTSGSSTSAATMTTAVGASSASAGSSSAGGSGGGGATGGGVSKSSTSSSISHSRPGGFFWSRNLQSRSQSDQDNESSSGDEGAAAAFASRHYQRTGEKSILKNNSLKINSSSSIPAGNSAGLGGATAGASSACSSISSVSNNGTGRGTSMPKSREVSPVSSSSRKIGRSTDTSPVVPGSLLGEQQQQQQRLTPTQQDMPVKHSLSGTLQLSSGLENVASSGDLSSRQKSVDRVDLVGHNGGVGGGDGSGSNNGDNNPKSSGSSSNDCLFQRNNSTASISTSSAATTSQTSSSPLGIIEVALLYDDSHQALHCSVLHAKDLTPMDVNGLSDPYCILKLIPSRFEGTHLRTKTMHKSVNPIFNETLTFYGVTPHDLTWQTLQILVMDDDRWGKDCLGTTQIPLHRIRSQQTRSFAQSLERGRLSEEREWGRGRLLLSLTYLTEKSLLLVGVIQAQDLPALDHNGTSDPFVKVRLLHDTNLGALSSSCFSINRKFRTSVKWRTLNPEFREEFSLKVSIIDLPRLALVISVWDKDLGKNDDYIGGIVLSTGSKGERLKHWLDMMKLPNTKHFKWHTLSPSVLPNH